MSFIEHFKNIITNRITKSTILEELFALSLPQSDFIKYDTFTTFSIILTDTIERSQGIPEEISPLLWDSVVQNSKAAGLITMLADAITDEKDLFLVYKKDVKVVREATQEEQRQIEKDYKEKRESSVGIYISFKKYHRSRMVKLYATFEYLVLCSLNKMLNLAKAIQIKLHDLRKSVGLADAPVAEEQVKKIAEALGKGHDVYMDVQDNILTAAVDTSPAEKSIAFLNSKRAYYLGLPMSYISGIQTPGIGSTGEADMRAVERGLKQYFNTIVKPTFDALFGLKPGLTFTSFDYRNMESALEVVRTLDLVSEDLITTQEKRELVQQAFKLEKKIETKK